MTKQQEIDCGRLVDGICELGYQSCALTMFRPNCNNRKTRQPDAILSKQEEIKEGISLSICRICFDVDKEPVQSIEACRAEGVCALNDDETNIHLNLLHSKGVVLKVADTSQDTMGFYHPDIVQVESLIYDAGLNPDSTEPTPKLDGEWAEPRRDWSAWQKPLDTNNIVRD